jgi:two-component system response regulator FixJ
MHDKSTVYIVDDDAEVRGSLEMLLVSSGYRVQMFDSAHAFLAAGVQAKGACTLVDIRMPDMDGLALQREINRTIPGLPVIIMTGHGDVPMAVQAMKDGAIDFLEKPFEQAALLGALAKALARRDQPAGSGPSEGPHKALTGREREVFDLLVLGHQNKAVARELGISVRTVEIHRGRIMDKLNATTLADLVRVSMVRNS